MTARWGLLLGLSLAALGCGGKAKAPAFTTAPVEHGPVIGRVTATGTLSALVTVQVGAQVSGRILSLDADFNSAVKKGQVLARLDPSLFEAALAQARANEMAAQGNLARARAQSADSERKLVRAKALADQKLVAPADLDAATADAEMSRAGIQAAEGSLAQARAARQQAEVNLTYTVIASPIDGTVISRAVDVGQTVAASLQSPTLFSIAKDLSDMQVDTNVAEADVGKLKEGLEATFTVDAFPNRRFRGRIRQIRFAPQVVQNVVTYDAVIDVDNPELLLRPGMTANITFIYAEADDVLRVPNAALRFRFDDKGRDGGRPGPRPGGLAGGEGADGGRRENGTQPDRTVYVLRDEAPTPVKVRTGINDGSFTEITGGELKEGDLVITDRQLDQSRPGGPQGMGGMRRMF